MAEKKRILIIDDDIASRSFLVELLSSSYEPLVANDGSEGYRKVSQVKPDIVIIDLLVPKFDGWELCALIRENGTSKHIPVIVLTRPVDFELQLRAFELGADDLVLKPFHPRGLLARIRAVMRRNEEKSVSGPVMNIGDLRIDPERYECKISGKNMDLSVLEFKLFHYFARNLNRVLTRDLILKDVWTDSSVSARTIDTHICMLRKKLLVSTLRIVSLYGAGYILKETSDLKSFSQTDGLNLESV